MGDMLKVKWQHAECRVQWLKPRSCTPVKGSQIIPMENRHRWVTEFSHQSSLLSASIWPDQTGSSKGKGAGPTLRVMFWVKQDVDCKPMSYNIVWGCSLIRTELKYFLRHVLHVESILIKKVLTSSARVMYFLKISNKFKLCCSLQIFKIIIMTWCNNVGLFIKSHHFLLKVMTYPWLTASSSVQKINLTKILWM